MAELSTGVRTLIARMESNPEEFYGDAEKWRFMFSPNFREVMTEPEKGALHEALAEVRRKEFDERVMRRLLQDDMENQLINNTPYFTAAQIGGGFGRAAIMDSNTITKTGTASLKLGKQTLSESDIEQLKAAAKSPNLFK
jgi:hypothetical protein